MEIFTVALLLLVIIAIIFYACFCMWQLAKRETAKQLKVQEQQRQDLIAYTDHLDRKIKLLTAIYNQNKALGVLRDPGAAAITLAGMTIEDLVCLGYSDEHIEHLFSRQFPDAPAANAHL